MSGKVYALYKGEDIRHIGTIEEIAKKEGVLPETIKFYATPTYRKRRKNSKDNNYRSVVYLDD